MFQQLLQWQLLEHLSCGPSPNKNVPEGRSVPFPRTFMFTGKVLHERFCARHLVLTHVWNVTVEGRLNSTACVWRLPAIPWGQSSILEFNIELSWAIEIQYFDISIFHYRKPICSIVHPLDSYRFSSSHLLSKIQKRYASIDFLPTGSYPST